MTVPSTVPHLGIMFIEILPCYRIAASKAFNSYHSPVNERNTELFRHKYAMCNIKRKEIKQYVIT